MELTDKDLESSAILSIRRYLNKDYSEQYIKDNFSIAIKLIIENIKKSLKVDKNVKSETQGNRSVTYSGEYQLITNDIKMFLPTPFVKMY